MSSKCQNTIIWLDSNIRSMLELLVLKKYAESTSQHVKWTSGARVLISISADRLPTKPTGELVGWLPRDIAKKKWSADQCCRPVEVTISRQSTWPVGNRLNRPANVTVCAEHHFSNPAVLAHSQWLITPKTHPNNKQKLFLNPTYNFCCFFQAFKVVFRYFI